MKILPSLLFAILTCTFSLVHADFSMSSSSPAIAEQLTTAHNALIAKDWNIAKTTLDKALRENPNNADVHNLLGYYYRKRATPDLDKAFEHYNTALKLNPEHKGAHEYIGEAFLMVHNPAEAEKHLARLETICGNKTCEEYATLDKSIATYKAANK